jgi:PAS domain S-box-containing protein
MADSRKTNPDDANRPADDAAVRGVAPASEAWYRCLLENLDLGISVISPDFEIIMTNAGQAGSSEKPYCELVGAKCFAALEGKTAICHDCPGEKAMKVRHPVETERQGVRADGSRFDVRIKAVPTFDVDGHPTGFVEIVEDNTLRKQAEEAVSQSQQRLALHVERTPLGVIEWNHDFEVVAWNPGAEQIFGFSKAEAQGRHAAGLIVPESAREHVDRVWTDLLSRRGGLRSTNENVTKAGDIILCEWYNTPLVAHDGHVLGVASLVQDITDRKRAEEERIRLEAQLRQAQKMEAVGQLAGGVAHDFNNILTAILGNVELVISEIRAQFPGATHLLEGLDQIRQSGERASMLTRQLLAFSRRQLSQPTVFQLNQTLNEMEKMLRRLLSEDIVLETDLAPDLLCVRADAGQVAQTIMNLVVNARDAMPQGGRLTLATANVELDHTYCRKHADVQPGKYVCLRARDTGCGMDAKTLERAFEPFFTTKPVGQGTGLGLSMVYGIIKQAGGHIAVDSMPDDGTSFHVYLPAVEADATADRPARAGDEVAVGPETVLICEDDDAVRNLAEEMLARAGYTVLAASRGAEALRQASDHEGPIHLLVTDVIMPDMNGNKLAAALTERIPDLRTLFISGYTADVIAHHGVLNPGIEFLQKPFTRTEFLRRIRHALDRGRHEPADPPPRSG